MSETIDELVAILPVGTTVIVKNPDGTLRYVVTVNDDEGPMMLTIKPRNPHMENKKET